MNARQAYQQIWKQDRRFFGAQGQPAPRIRMVGKGGGYTTTGPLNGQWSDPRVIGIGLAARRQLKSNRPHAQQAVRYALEHEFGRYFGPDYPLADQSSGNSGAGNANFIANRLAHFRNTGRGNPTKAFRRRLPYAGQNPRTIKFPSGPA